MIWSAHQSSLKNIKSLISIILHLCTISRIRTPGPAIHLWLVTKQSHRGRYPKCSILLGPDTWRPHSEADFHFSMSLWQWKLSDLLSKASKVANPSLHNCLITSSQPWCTLRLTLNLWQPSMNICSIKINFHMLAFFSYPQEIIKVSWSILIRNMVESNEYKIKSFTCYYFTMNNKTQQNWQLMGRF